MKKFEYKPDYVVSPGRILKEQIEEKNLSPYEFAKILGVEIEFLNNLFVGKESIDEKLADIIGNKLGPSKQYWMRLEENFKNNQHKTVI